MTGQKKSAQPSRLWIAAKHTVRLREFESAVVEMAVEFDSGTPKPEILRLVTEADVAYAILREKVAARAFEAKVQAAREDSPKKVESKLPAAAASSETLGWRSRMNPHGRPGGK